MRSGARARARRAASPRWRVGILLALFAGGWLQRGRLGAWVAAAIALGLIVLAARVPLSGYTISDAKQHSPFLLAVFRLEKAVGIGKGALVVALVVSALACLAAPVAFRPVFVRWAVGAILAASVFVSFGAVAFDSHVVFGDVKLVQTPATPHAAADEQLFWNRSLKRLYFRDDASAIDAFGSARVHAAPDGRLISGAQTLRGPLLVSNYAVRAQLSGAVSVARAANYQLWRPAGTPRMALFVGGLCHDGWLAQGGHITVWPARDGRVWGVLRLPLSLPPKPRSERTVLQLRGPGVVRRVTVEPGKSVVLSFRVSAVPGPFASTRTGPATSPTSERSA